ncbi:GDP-mannose 4,6-dehydratase [Bilophila wadsworthia]|jgi:nucleoside-diphosphate-sugar epimerase|uniref:GDP-mannose 4,6-dehydratase n=1 Tax=Bilophila wadsworthia TaxID=35833 RepID=UPI00241BE75A|nr:GDP-mannose 4,6-dehydratase [Bilophila wadsworthia]
MKKALITGVDGFTGVYLAEELTSAGYDVAGIGLAPEPAALLMGGYFRVDMMDLPSLETVISDIRPDAVFHLAAMSHVTRDTAEQLYRINIMATRNLLEALCTGIHTPEAVILASTANLYGSREGILSEDTPLVPQNDYAVSKLAMEYMAALWKKRLPLTIVRPFNYTGRGQSGQFLIPKLIRHFAAHTAVIEMGNTDVSRDFSDVRDVVAAYTRLAVTRAPWGPFNICSGTAHSLDDILEMLREMTGYCPEIRINPAFVRYNDVKRLQGSRQRLEAQIGDIKPRPLRETLHWMLDGAIQEGLNIWN